MPQTIIIHGSSDREEYYGEQFPSPSNSHWIPWLQRQLNFRDQISIAPEMPRPYDPNYADWSAVMDQFDIDHATTLIGHSSGAGFLLRYVSENIGKTPQQLILVAPWMDPNRELTDVGFFDFEIDSTITDICDVHVFISRDDGVEMLDTVTLIQRELPKATVHEFTNRGHFCTAEFPELLLNSSLEKVTQTYPLTISYDSLLVYHISSSSASRQEV